MKKEDAILCAVIGAIVFFLSIFVMSIDGLEQIAGIKMVIGIALFVAGMSSLSLENK